LSRTLEFAFRDAGVPYQIAGGVEFFQRMEIKDVQGYLRLLNNPADDEAFLRTINTPARGIGKTTIKKITERAQQAGLPLLETARRAGQMPELNKKTQGLVLEYTALVDRLATHA